MIVGLTIKNFKGLREVINLPLSFFHVLVGPNGVGKSSFLDAIDFVRDCVTNGPWEAVRSRLINDFNDLTWFRKGGAIEIGVWLDLSDSIKSAEGHLLYYRISIVQDAKLGVHGRDELFKLPSMSLFSDVRETILDPKVDRLLGKTTDGSNIYFRENEPITDEFSFKINRLTLALLPPDEIRYPTANAVLRFLSEGVRYVQLNSTAMRQCCPPTRSADLDLDGSNLARVVGRMLGSNGGLGPHWPKPDSPVTRWMEHLRFAIPDLVNIGWARRQIDNGEYLILRYSNGLEAPSWMLSDGTLRMMALTISAYLPPQPGVYLVEEPENGIHPKALEIVLRSLSFIPGSQSMVATHSPLVVQQCGVAPLLCFSRDEQGTRITPGSKHPMLMNWEGSIDLGLVFAAGVLE